MIVAACKRCVYFDETLDEYTKDTWSWAEGVCRRYPDGDLKTRDRWCGEFVPRNRPNEMDPFMFPTQESE